MLNKVSWVEIPRFPFVVGRIHISKLHPQSLRSSLFIPPISLAECPLHLQSFSWGGIHEIQSRLIMFTSIFNLSYPDEFNHPIKTLTTKCFNHYTNNLIDICIAVLHYKWRFSSTGSTGFHPSLL